jgi:hypothetical protein
MGTRELWLSVVLPWQERRKQVELAAAALREQAEVVDVASFKQRSRAGSRR